MFAVSYNKFILFFSVLIFYTLPLCCMKRQLETSFQRKTKKCKIEDISALPLLPFELEKQIFVDHLPEQATTSPFRVICHTINAISLVNTQWNSYINHPNTIRMIINTINDYAQNFSVVNRFMIAKTIQTAGTKNYIHQCSALYSKIKRNLPLSPYSIKKLVEMGADINFEHLKGYFLHLTIKNNDYTYTKQLLDLGANPNPTQLGETALDLAIKKENVAIIELLLQYNPKNKGLLAALEKGNASLVKLLLAQKNLTDDELHQGLQRAFRTIPPNPACQILIDYFFTNAKILSNAQQNIN